ncbi:methyltransferase domain protein [Leptospira yanagawae serovar Saopaulo str. Sao Paulo = ATCC 700523]|uniref:Methyltransferase domain protein n=2 Tax=Leptospira yanagawae TaxID=293069 RepID=A0A5E8HB26_9LEPT|nr:methyltransferase domain protein [Leptospira yanagawae serovar Saopaulo str. Sao Paulo = ATCC 700523]
MNCPLCDSTSIPFYQNRFRSYLVCQSCDAIFMDQQFWPTPECEKKRYLEHNNDIYDTGYQNFLKPIVEKILQNQTIGDKGLDFGAGPGPVVQYLLKQNGHSISLYDPYFHPYQELLKETYDYIVLTEVVEHFHSPKKEFQVLSSMLQPKGRLYILTHPYDDSINFEKWYYKNDQTHTFFYTKKSFVWIKETYGFQNLMIENRMIILEK